MAVTKLWKVSVRLGQVLDYTTNPEKTANPEYSPEDYQALKDVLAYAKDEEKTEHEFFCDGINCNVAMARDQFITVKEQFGKTDGIQAYHGYLSFKENEVTPEQAQQIGMEFAIPTGLIAFIAVVFDLCKRVKPTHDIIGIVNIIFQAL